MMHVFDIRYSIEQIEGMSVIYMFVSSQPTVPDKTSTFLHSFIPTLASKVYNTSYPGSLV